MVYLFSLLVLILIKCDVTKQDIFLLFWLNHLKLLSKIICYYHSNRKYPKINLHLLLALILKQIQHHKKDMSCFVTFFCKTKGSRFSYLLHYVCNALYSYRVPQNYRYKVSGSEGHKNEANPILILCMFFYTSGHLV